MTTLTIDTLSFTHHSMQDNRFLFPGGVIVNCNSLSESALSSLTYWGENRTMTCISRDENRPLKTHWTAVPPQSKIMFQWIKNFPLFLVSKSFYRRLIISYKIKWKSWKNLILINFHFIYKKIQSSVLTSELTVYVTN